MKLKGEKGVFVDLLICICSLTGLIININLFKTPVVFLYYTIFSNILCFIFYVSSFILKMFTNFKRCVQEFD